MRAVVAVFCATPRCILPAGGGAHTRARAAACVACPRENHNPEVCHEGRWWGGGGGGRAYACARCSNHARRCASAACCSNRGRVQNRPPAVQAHRGSQHKKNVGVRLQAILNSNSGVFKSRQHQCVCTYVVVPQAKWRAAGMARIGSMKETPSSTATVDNRRKRVTAGWRAVLPKYRKNVARPQKVER